ncbi:MAG: hypothetical protein ABSG04_08720 [Verrucomicrobiota bacterium]|jgi:hypothetical protein
MAAMAVAGQPAKAHRKNTGFYLGWTLLSGSVTSLREAEIRVQHDSGHLAKNVSFIFFPGGG